MVMMRHESGSREELGVRFGWEARALHPTVPEDIGTRTQQQRILVALSESCAEKSFARTTIADIVQRAGISRATFYKHFDNKRECFITAVKAFFADLQATVTVAQADTEKGLDALEKGTAAILDHLAANPAHANLALIEAATVEPEISWHYRDLVIEVLGSELGEGRERSGADPSIAFGRAQVLIAEYLVSDRASRLPELLPEIVYVALMPFVGQEEALEYASQAL